MNSIYGKGHTPRSLQPHLEVLRQRYIENYSNEEREHEEHEHDFPNTEHIRDDGEYDDGPDSIPETYWDHFSDDEIPDFAI